MQSSNISHASSADRRITSRNRLKCIIEVYFEQRRNGTYPRIHGVDAFKRPLANIFHLSDDFRRRKSLYQHWNQNSKNLVSKYL